jgi:hypothetical protein
MSLSPAATDIYVVSGASPLDQFFESLARDAYRRYKDKFKISYLNGLPMDELLQTVADLSQNSIIIYFSYHKDNSGRLYYPAHALKLITDRANAEIKSHLWITPHESASYPGMTHENFPWTLSKINDGQSVCFQSLSRLPAEAQTERMICETIPIRSLYVLPLFSGK